MSGCISVFLSAYCLSYVLFSEAKLQSAAHCVFNRFVFVLSGSHN